MLKRRRTEQDHLLDARSFLPPAPLSAPSPATLKRRRRRRGTFSRQLGAVAGIAVLLYAGLPILLRGSKMLPVAEETLSRSLGRKVRIGSVRFSPTFGSIAAYDVTVADDPLFSSAPFLHAQRVDLDVRRLPLILDRRLEITGISLEEPTITMIRNAAQWNFYAILAAGPTPPDTTSGPAVRVARGLLVIRSNERDEPFILRDLDFYSAHLSTAMDNVFTLNASVEGGGKLKLEGRAGPVRLAGQTPSVPVNVLVSARKIELARSNLTAALAPGIDGQMSMDGALEADDARLRISGNADFANLKLSEHGAPAKEPLRFTFGIDHDLASGSGTVNRFDAMLPKGVAGVTGTYSITGHSARVNLRVTGQGVAVTPVSGLLQAAGLPLPPGASLQGGLAFIDLTVDGNVTGPTTKGSLTLNNTKLMNFDLEERLSAITGLDALHIPRDLAIDVWKADVEATPEKLVVKDLEIDLPQVGVLTGNGVIHANRTLEFQMNAVRHGLSDKRPIPFLVHGACVAPIFRQPGKGA